MKYVAACIAVSLTLLFAGQWLASVAIGALALGVSLAQRAGWLPE